MPFLTYQPMRSFGKSIREVVFTRRLPPWFADPHADCAKPAQFVSGRNSGNPDLVVEMLKPSAVAARGTIE